MVEIKEKITNWIIKNQEKYKIAITELTGLKKYNSNFYDFKIQLMYKNLLIIGRGTSYNQDIALIKAFAESIERLALEHYEFNISNGLAAHTSYESAKINARNELFEHDSFLCNFLTKNTLERCDNLNTFKINNFHINTYYLSKSSIGNSILVTITSKDKNKSIGLVSGTSFNENVNIAIQNATFEALRSLDYILDQKKYDSISIEDFNQLDNYTFKSHRLLSRDPNYPEYFFNSLKDNFQLNFNYQDLLIKYEYLDLDFISPELPLKVVRATCNELQKMYLGKTSRENINYERLKKITGLNNIDINLIPHPFD